LKTARTIITMMISRMMMPMHSHFLEFFWSDFARCKATVPAWTCSTALVT
jgi:hypothetical protein